MPTYRSLIAGALCVPLAAPLVRPQLALAQVVLPEVVVSAPSPIRRPAAPPANNNDALQGDLPVITDQFATITVVPESEIRRTPSASLGELLSNKPGITSSGFAPGSNRPIVRGLDNNRVRIQENGIGSNDASELGEDHGVPIDPLGAKQIEVVRGPATLRFGSQAIGGVVNVDNNRIPTALPPRGFAGEINGAVTSVDRGREGSLLLDAGKGPMAVHADVYGRGAADYRIPAYPYLFAGDPSPAVGSRQPNSANRSNGAAFGGSYIFDNGFVGAAVSQFDSLYRIPGQEAAATGTRIDLQQTKLTSKGELRPDSSTVEALRFWFGATDYKHNELANENGFDGIQQTFTNRSQELRVEAQMLPFDLHFAQLTSAIGAQLSHQKLDAPGVEGGLFDPNRTSSAAAYLFNEFRFNTAQRVQISGRIEGVNVRGAAPEFPADFLPLAGDPESLGRKRSFTPASVAVGFLQDLPADLVGSVTAQRVERAPRAAELFSRGAHEATGTFDIGDPNLGIETATSLEAGIRRNKGPLRFEATAYVTRFDGFIYRNLTGNSCDGDFASCVAGTGAELRQAVYAQRDALFRGAELQAQYDVAPLWRGQWGVDAQYDILRATFTDGSNVPRIPPQRLGGGIYFRDTEWFARVGLLHAFPQTHFSDRETRTGSYNLLKAELSYTTKLRDRNGPREITVGVTGTNLLNDDVRNSASFNKDEVLMPGRNARLFATLRF